MLIPHRSQQFKIKSQWCYLETHIKWYDFSGGGIHQVALTDANNAFIRTGSGESWGAWKLMS